MCLDRAKYLDEAFLNVLYSNFDIIKDYLFNKLVNSNDTSKKQLDTNENKLEDKEGDKDIETDKNDLQKKVSVEFKGGLNKKQERKMKN